MNASNCIICHSEKPRWFSSLKNIRKHRSSDWIYNWVQNSAKFITENKEAYKLHAKYGLVSMPGFMLTKKEIDEILNYIDSH